MRKLLRKQGFVPKPAAARAGPAAFTPPRGKDSGIAPIAWIRNGTVAAFATASCRSALRRRRPIPGGVPPAIVAIEHDSGTGDGGEHPFFRRAERGGTYRANGDQKGDPARTRVIRFAARKRGMRVGGEPAGENYG
jgi:hypothetical protein